MTSRATRYLAALALLPGGPAERVLLEVEGGRITAVTPGAADPPGDAVVLEGLTLPGLANAHCHAFHRLLRGRAQRRGGDFWAWRERMYEVAAALDPDAYFEVARALYAELLLAGYTAVGEFHYLHHQPGGAAYQDPNAMGNALLAAAAAAGIRLTLLDTCYLWGGFGRRPPDPVQRRFSDGTPERWAARVEHLGLDHGPRARAGAAIHSVRAVDREELPAVARWAGAAGVSLHLHLSEQPAENRACLEHTGRTPAALLAEAGALGERTTAVHATHLAGGDLELLARAGATVCLCPTTERDLGDGIGPARELRAAGVRLSIGSDSNAVVDPFEEARAIELDDRLRLGRRGLHDPEDLLAAATRDGYAALGWDHPGLVPGALADFVTVDLGSPRLAGGARDDLAAAVVFAATAADVRGVVVAGEQVVRGGRHRRHDVPALLEAALRQATPPGGAAPPLTPSA